MWNIIETQYASKIMQDLISQVSLQITRNLLCKQKFLGEEH